MKFTKLLLTLIFTFLFIIQVVPAQAFFEGWEATQDKTAVHDFYNAVESEVGNVSKTVGRDITDYKGTFFEQHPDLEGKVVVHHGVEQQVLKRPETSGLFTESEMHSYENLRGIPKELNSDLHLSKIRKEWNRFYRDNPFPTKEDLLNKRQEIDNMFGDLFNPPIKR